MAYVDARACWFAASLFTVVGIVAACDVWGVARSRRYKRLLWLLPVLVASVWLESAFGGASSQLSAASVPSAALYRRMATDLIGWPVLALAFVWLRRTLPANKSSKGGGKSKPPPSDDKSATRTEGGADMDLRAAMEHFIAAVDKADVATVAAAYAPDFCCVRVADEGGFAHLSREQMLAFLNRAVAHAAGGKSGGEAVATRETVFHHAEVRGDTGFVLLTRVKNLGSGWEPLFYNFVWQRHEGGWRLVREFAHQKTVPRHL